MSSIHHYNPDKLRGFDKAGYTPVVSTFSGLARVMIGIFILSTTRLDEDDQNNETKKALYNRSISLGKQMIARGLIEMIPVIGNIIMGIHDFTWYSKHKSDLAVLNDGNNAEGHSPVKDLTDYPIISFQKA